MNHVSPDQVGLCASRLDRLDTLLQRLIDNQELAGTVTLVARQGQVAHFKAQGWQDLETRRPMGRDSLFRIYSMTKPITSVAVLMLFEEGHFRLTDPVAGFIPAFADLCICNGPGYTGLNLEPLRRPITIRDLLTHTAGLSYGFYEDSPVEQLYRDAALFDSTCSLPDMLEKLVRIPLMFQPGTAWRYSMASDVLGRLVEVVSGRPLDRFFADRIFEPLDMAETFFHVPEDKLHRLAAIYQPADEGGLELTGDEWRKDLFDPSNCLLLGGSGLVSTATDYVRFCQMLLNRGELNGARLLGRKTVALMTANHIPPDQLPLQTGPTTMDGYGFGLGVRVMLDPAQAKRLGSVGEYGWAGLATTYFFIDPREDLIGILMAQLIPPETHPVRIDFHNAVYQALVD
ncbi:MAG: serine hydrolase domain-containing protein [Anaerolineae bacterium]|nr:serine hydrolase domain-containing protein [Anaerolineae bacterium]